MMEYSRRRINRIAEGASKVKRLGEQPPRQHYLSEPWSKPSISLAEETERFEENYILEESHKYIYTLGEEIYHYPTQIVTD